MIKIKKNKKKSNFPKISIITPVLNSKKKIRRCIESIINQKYPKNKIEHIIIDGGSKDGTLNIIKEYKNKIKYWHSKKDNGLYDAMNIGISKAKGDIICILNSDDYFYKNCFKIVSKYFSKKPIDFLFGSVMKNRIYHNFFPEKIWYKFNVYPSHSISFFIKKKSHNLVGKYNLKFKHCADRDYLYRAIVTKRLKGMATKKKEVFGKFDMYGISSKLTFIQKNIEEIKIRINNKQNFFEIFSVFIVFCFYYLFRSVFKRN